MSASPCGTFTPRSERDVEACGACGWSRGSHAGEPADEPPSTDRPGYARGLSDHEVFRPGGILDQRVAGCG